MRGRDKLINFLEGNFHQDIESFDDVLEELKEENKEYLNDIVKCIDVFLKSDLSVKSKENFIKEHTYIYFSEEEDPIEWIINLSSCINCIFD